MKTLSKLQNDAQEEFKQVLFSKFNEEDFKTKSKLEDFLNDEEFSNDEAWEIADRWVPINYSDLIELFSGDAFEIRENFDEMVNEIGSTETQDIFEIIKQGIFWAIYRDLYNNIESIKEEFIEDFEEFDEEETE